MQNLENIIRTTAIEWYDLQKDRLCLYIKQSSRLLWSIFSTICTYKLKSSEGSTLFLAQICQLWPKNSLYLNPIVQNTQYFFKIAMCRQARGLEIQMWPQNKQILRGPLIITRFALSKLQDIEWKNIRYSMPVSIVFHFRKIKCWKTNLNWKMDKKDEML